MRIMLAAIVCILYLSPASAQTVSDIEAKYGRPVKAYVVSENIWMTPDYTVDGQVCQIRLYPKRIDSDTSYLSVRLPFQELKDVLNQLVPLKTRGMKKESFGTTATGGGVVWTTYSYETVTFIFAASFKVDPNSGKESKPYDFSQQKFPADERSENSVSADGDFLRSKASSAEIVTIQWNDRKCAGK